MQPGRLVFFVGAIAVALVSSQRRNAAYPEDTTNIITELINGISVIIDNKSHLEEFTTALYQQIPLPLNGKKVLITGATRGLGRGIAAHFRALGADLYLPCRTIPKGLETQLDEDADMLVSLHSGAGKEMNRGHVYIWHMDLGNLNSIDAAVLQLKKQIPLASIDILINNAGLISPFGNLTKQGFEMSFGVNFLGTARFTLQLIEIGLLKNQARIVSVSSEDHRASRRLNSTGAAFGAPWSTGVADTMERYAYSKLAQTTFFTHLALVERDFVILDICPGPVASDIARGVGVITDIATFFMGWLFQSKFKAALPILQLSIAPQFQTKSGKHFHMAAERPARSDAIDPLEGEILSRLTRSLLADRRAPTK